MAKVITPLSIDENIKREAKAKQVNMSAIAEQALREKLNKQQVEFDSDPTNCQFCGREGSKENAEDVKMGRNRANGLTWLWPDEKWICNTCLRSFGKNIIK